MENWKNILPPSLMSWLKFWAQMQNSSSLKWWSLEGKTYRTSSCLLVIACWVYLIDFLSFHISSGLQVMSNEEACDCMTELNDAQEAAEELVREAFYKRSLDDISCVVVMFHHWLALSLVFMNTKLCTFQITQSSFELIHPVCCNHWTWNVSFESESSQSNSKQIEHKT